MVGDSYLERIDVELHICPVCRKYVEWQGDFGYLCEGNAVDKHPEAFGLPVRGEFLFTSAELDGQAARG
jgi:hypothetical protein